MPKSPTTTAVTKLRISKLNDQKQLIVNDVELASLNLALKGKASTSIVDAVTDGEVSRTIEGASTVRITLLDRDREILRSGRLTAKTDILLDGLWFRLTSISKNAESLTLTFEDREVAVMRTYNDHIVVARKTLSRSRFIKRMVNEVKEFKIPFVCPEIDKLPPVRLIKFESHETNSDFAYERSPGFPGFTPEGNPTGSFVNNITVGGLSALPDQLANTDRVLKVGAARGASHSCLVAAIMVINEESGARNLDHSSDGLSAGLFQQIYEPHKYAWGTKAEVMNIEWSANRFFDGAIRAYNSNPAMQPEYIALNAQVAGNQEARIIPIWRGFREEAERTVSRWGVPKGSTSALPDALMSIPAKVAEATANLMGLTPKELAEAKTIKSPSGAVVPGTPGLDTIAASLNAKSEDYQFHRGISSIQDGQPKWILENTWDCAGRLAEEINWRRFMVSGSFYLMSERYLFRSKPYMKISEDTPGVSSIDGDYTTNMKNSTCTIICELGRWEAPPGSMIEVFKMGPISGRWLVSEIRRNLFDATATISCKKPRPILPEPNLDQEKAQTFSLADQTPTSGSGTGVGTITVPVVPAEALGALRDLINDGSVTFDHSNDRQGLLMSSSILRGDGVLVGIDPTLIQFIVWAGQNFPTIRVSSLIGSHSQNVAGSNRESRHWTGHAADLGSIRSERVDSSRSRTAVIAFMTEVGKLLGLTPNQMICNGCGIEDSTVQALQLDNHQPKGGHWVSDHTDHVHIGY